LTVADLFRREDKDLAKYLGLLTVIKDCLPGNKVHLLWSWRWDAIQTPLTLVLKFNLKLLVD
jgi:hypothetical protein